MRSLSRQSFCMAFTHDPQRVCNNFKSPQASHRVIFFLSSSAFPMSCRFRFWECVVFFFGTARRIESHIPVMIGMSVVIEGMAKRKEGRRGATGCGVKGASRARWRRRKWLQVRIRGGLCRMRGDDLLSPRNAAMSLASLCVFDGRRLSRKA